MNLGPSKVEREMQETLRQKVLANPEAHGLRGSLSDGVNVDRMRELVREYEEKEKNRIEASTKEVRKTTSEEKGKKGEAIPSNPGKEEQVDMVVAEKKCRKCGKAYAPTSNGQRYCAECKARVKAERLEQWNETRKKRAGSGRARAVRKRAARTPKDSSVLAPRSSPLDPVFPAPTMPQESKYKVHCMACGFCMEITGAALASLADGGET